MKRLILTSLAALLVLSASVAAGTIAINFGSPVTITTTAAQDAKLALVLAKINTERAAQELPPFTIEQWIRSVLVAALTSYAEQAEDLERTEACDTFTKLSDSEKASIVKLLGNRRPCKQ